MEHVPDTLDDTEVHSLAIELWCTIIEEEYTLTTDNKEHHKIIEKV